MSGKNDFQGPCPLVMEDTTQHERAPSHLSCTFLLVGFGTHNPVQKDPYMAAILYTNVSQTVGSDPPVVVRQACGSGNFLKYIF